MLGQGLYPHAPIKGTGRTPHPSFPPAQFLYEGPPVLYCTNLKLRRSYEVFTQQLIGCETELDQTEAEAEAESEPPGSSAN